ncbi:DNA-binding bromodomain-containing protein [Zea mays]|uniref:DNA-binding bromodomain-containing protein n=1 Tax=Zea mays TaxID=4577 RepID=A0A1D6IB05_MAIZE|nr:DNA-binding bromodomain-containing protein [Zea mays]
MDFSTIRKKLDKEAYFNLEQFEDDVFLITSNAMCYNSPDTIYYRQARGIQEIAKKDFENLRQDSDASEPEPEPEREPKPEPEPEEPKPQPRRGRPPNKNNAKQKVGKPPAERATADFSGATLATAANIGRHAQADVDLSRRVMDKAMIADVLRASFANLRNEHNWSGERLWGYMVCKNGEEADSDGR